MLAAALLVIGVVIGRIWFGIILLPLIYGVPRTAWQIWRRRLRPTAIVLYIFPVVLWSTAFVVLALALTFFSRSVAMVLWQSSAFSGGQFIGVVLGFMQMASREGRRDLDVDFSHATSTFQRHRIES